MLAGAAVLVALAALGLCGCSQGQQAAQGPASAGTGVDVTAYNQELISAAGELAPSEQLFFEGGIEVTGLGVTYDGRPTSFDGCYYFPAIEAKTGAHVQIDWQEDAGYSSAVATTLMLPTEKLPDILNPSGFGVMELAEDGLIVALDEYLDLMPNIVAAVGEERMSSWRSADGHIYTIPSVSGIQGSFSWMLRQDWLEALGMSTPQSWDDWLSYWRGVRDNDLNGNGDASDEIPLALPMGADGERSLTPLLNAFGIKASNDTQFCLLDDGSYTMVYEHPRYGAFLQAVAGLYEEGILPQDYSSYSYASIEEAMGADTLGSTATFAASGAQTQTLRDSGVEGALWKCVEPLPGPDGCRMIQERELVSPTWAVTAGAVEKGKVEDIVRLFDWCFSAEGAALYNYGIEGVSYTLSAQGEPVLDPALVANGFADYRAVGINYEPFGGYWLQDAYMQCLFSGKDGSELSDIQAETYSGLFTLNNGCYYTQPPTLETKSYIKHRTKLITEGVCKLRDQAISGQISSAEFQKGYKRLKAKGLAEVIAEGSALYKQIEAQDGER
ncbi:MAG: hypothetical protein ACI36W_01995 [Coriobacteriales bacterium]